MKRKLMAAILVSAISTVPALAADTGGSLSPSVIRYWIDDIETHPVTDHFLISINQFYIQGVYNTIIAIQDRGIIGKAICNPPGTPDTYGAIKGLSPNGFPDSEDGGIAYIYSAMVKKYPCK